MPAAVIINGNIWGRLLAASSTASYPAIVAIDDSTSIVWARVTRGTRSKENAETPFAAWRCALWGAHSGSKTPTNTVAGTAAGLRDEEPIGASRTETTTSATPASGASRSTMVAPARRYASSSKPELEPALRSTDTSHPRCTNAATPSGTSATRFSLGADSRNSLRPHRQWRLAVPFGLWVGPRTVIW